MRKYSFTYLADRSVRSFARNSFMSIASILILSSCLLIIGCFGLLIYNLYQNLDALDGLNEIVCMCDYDLQDGEEKVIEEKIKGYENVESVTFISKEEAFAEQIKQYASFPKILEYFEKSNFAETTPSTDNSVVTGPVKPEEDTSESTNNGRKIVFDAITKRQKYNSYTYQSTVITEMLGVEVEINGIEQFVRDGDKVDFLIESGISGEVLDAKYYTDGVLYVGGEDPRCGKITIDEFYSLNCMELYRMDWIADFSNYTVLETDKGYAVTMNGIDPDVVIDAFDLSSAIPTEETPKISGYATVVVDKNGDLISENFNISIVVATSGDPFELGIKYTGEISNIDSLKSIDFNMDELSEYEETDDIVSSVIVPEPEDTESADTSSKPSDTAAKEDDVTDVQQDQVTDGEENPAGNISLDNNPLSDAFKVVYKDIDGISKLRDSLMATEGIRSVKDAADAAATLQNLKDTVMVIFIGFFIILLLISVIIVMNTIGMSISAREDEILVMRYIGATGFFVSFPFMLESLIIGLISTVIAYLLQYGIYGYLCSLIYTSGQDISSFLIIAPFSEIWWQTLIAYLAVASMVCLLGSKISLAKHIKV